MQMILKWTNRFVTSVLIILLVSVALMVIPAKISGEQPEIFGYQLKSVLSGSMEPGIQTGSVIAVKSIEEEGKSNLQEGDIITFLGEEDKLITHRITEVSATENDAVYTTKGDNNNTKDSSPVLAENVIGLYNGFTIPYAGYVAQFTQSSNGIIFSMIIPGLLMLGYAGFTIWKIIRQLDDRMKNSTKGLE